jgi:hypothetical protein
MPYAIDLRSPNAVVFREDGGDRTESFHAKEISRLIDLLLDRKSRNNGTGRQLFGALRATGFCSYTHERSHWNGRGFMCFRAAGTVDQYHLQLVGDYVADLLRFLNTDDRATFARKAAITKAFLKERASPPLPKGALRIWKLHPLAGAGADLRRHFHHTHLDWRDATSIVARAARLSLSMVDQKMRRSLDVRGAAVLWVGTSFVFRINISYTYRGLLDLDAPVELFSTKDNQHAVYRRLRTMMRKHLKRERRADKQRQILFRRLQKLRRMEKVLFRVA